jgi:uncharacterized protein (TIGR02099 family)
MQKPPEETVTDHVPLAVRWHRVRTCYRILNLASHHALGFTIKLVLLAYFAFAILFLFLRYAILPNIDYYKSDIERFASKAAGNRVTISRIYASWSGLRPNLFLADVTLRDSQGRQALNLPSVSATLSWWTLLAAEVRFDSLEVVRPDLQLTRAADGKLYAAGLPIDTGGGGDGKGGDWLLSQREIVIREGRLRWSDQLRGAPDVALENVNLVLHNRWLEHQFALQATPPAALAGPIDVRADFSHPAFSRHVANVAMWTGELYADLKDADLAAWKTYIDYPFELTRGRGALRAWLTMDHARLAGFTADIGLADVAARLGRSLPAVDLMRVTGRVSASEAFTAGAVADGKPTFGARGFTAGLKDFALETRDGLVLAPTTLSAHYVAASGKQPDSTEIKATLLDLQTLAALAERFPLTQAQRAQLDNFAPRGHLVDFSALWSGAFPAVSAYRIKGKVEGLGLKAQPPRLAQAKTATAPAQAAVPAIPGFENLTGTIDTTEKGGSFSLDSSNLLLQLPSYFSDAAMPFEKLAVQARWSLERDAGQQDQLRLQVDNMDFVQQGIIGSLHGSYLVALNGAADKSGKKNPGTADISATLTHFDVKNIGRYLPLSSPPDFRAWLTGALVSGLGQDVSVRLRGDLAQFPFHGENPGHGEFRVAGRIENGTLNYAPNHAAAHDPNAPMWPLLENIQGSFLFERGSMDIRGDTARTGNNIVMSGIKAVIPDMTLNKQTLIVDGNAYGAMPDYLKYVADSPVFEWIARFTDQTTASGNARLGLHLQLPLSAMADAKVQGALQLLGNDIVLFDDLPPILATGGRIEFYEKGFNLNGVAGTFLGGPLALSGGSQHDNSIQVRVSGSMTADGMRKNYPAPATQRLFSHFSGGARYSGVISERDRQVQIAIDSPLTGLGLDLPAPLKKSVAEPMPLKFVLSGGAAGENGVEHDDIRIALGASVNARYQREKQTTAQNGRAPWRLLRGGIGVNTPAPEPDSGMMINVSMKTLNVDAWNNFTSAINGNEPAKAGDADDSNGVTQYVVPDVIAARADELVLGERKLENVVVGASQQRGQNGVWQANIDSRQVSGFVTWSDTASGPGKLTARLSSLIIPESAEADVKDLLEGKNAAARTIPALDVVAERFELFNKKLGRVELQAYNALANAGREWRISKLSLTNPDGELKGSGKWVISNGQSSTSLNFALDIADAGKLLDRLGFADTVSKGKGTLSGDIAWKGLPYSLDIPSLSGQLDMNVENGQFLKQDPGAAKLLGVLSLQALPHLLKLDFHDVFSQGLAFDGISAHADIARGVLKTDDLKMHGVAATVLMDGSADIANESTNLHVVVMPEFNLGTGPLVYALAVNPVVGVGSFLAQLFLRDPVMKALTYQMQITGPWKAPSVVKLANNKADAAPVKTE